MTNEILHIKASAPALLELLHKEKKKLIASKKIQDKKDKSVYPVSNIPFNIPSHWVWCYLSDISIIQEGPGIRKHQYSVDGVQFLTVTNILEGSVDLEKSKKYISNEQYKAYSHFTINKGDIVTACSGGSWGKSAIYELDEKIILNTSTLRLRFFNDLGDNKYLYYLTKASYFKESLSKYTTGQQPNYGYAHYSQMPIPLPPFPEQQRIANILDKAFAAIDKAKANAEQNLKNAKELFESYLQSVFENKGEDWEEKTLSEVCAKITDGTHQTPTYYTDGIIFLSSKNVTNGKINWDDIKYIDEKQHLEMHKRVAPRINDILLAKNGTTGVAAMVDKEVTFDIYVSLALIRVLEKVLPTFMLYFINSPVAKQQFNQRLKGIGVPNLHLEEIREVVITFPKSLKEQKTIVQKLDALSAETKKLEAIYQKKIEDLEELKKSILQKAFSGSLNYDSSDLYDYNEKSKREKVQSQKSLQSNKSQFRQ